MVELEKFVEFVKEPWADFMGLSITYGKLIIPSIAQSARSFIY